MPPDYIFFIEDFPKNTSDKIKKLLLQEKFGRNLEEKKNQKIVLAQKLYQKMKSILSKSMLSIL